MADGVDFPAQGIVKVPVTNYLSKEFLQQEKLHLWPKIWQVACREEEIPKAGDYIVYEVADETIIVVRRPEGEIKAFHNVCPHRGRKIMDGCGHAVNFRCQYHNWTFDLDGKNVAVQDRDDWAGTLDGEQIDLFAVKTGVWGGFVWINMDADSETLDSYLESIPQFLDPFEYEKLRYRWYLEITVPCNWKVALEAFMEAYHVAGTHPQLLPYQGTDYTQSYAHGKHAHFGYWEGGKALGSPSPRLKRADPDDFRPGVIEFFRQMEEDFGAIFTDRDYAATRKIMDTVPATADAMTAFGTAIELGRQAAQAEGADYPAELGFEELGKAGSGWHIFPNCVTLPWFDGAVWYRARPNGDDPDSCIFNIWSLKRYAPGQEPALERRVIKDPAGMSFGLIIDQDLANMAAVHKGMKSSAFHYAKPNPKQEMEIINFHRMLERYFGAG